MVDSNVLLNLIQGLDDALIWMINTFNQEKNWGSVRETAYVLDLSIQYKFAFQSSFIYDATDWLQYQRRGDSWMEEQWETAMCLKCLSKVKEIDVSEIIKAAEDWIKHKQDSRDGLWNDELWESSFVLWYFLEAGTDETLDLIRRPMRWLTSQQSVKEGNIVVPHYTAFYLILQSYLKTDTFAEGRKRAVDWFMRNYSSEQLWSDVCYSNGYAIYGLLRNGVKFSEAMKVSLINQVLEVQDEEKSWGEENIEDTYAYLLGLRELLQQEVALILKKKQLKEQDWKVLEAGYLQYFQHIDKLNMSTKVRDELIKRQIKKIKNLVEKDEKLPAFLLFCLLINQEIYSAYKPELDEIIEIFLGFSENMIENAEYELLYHFLQTLTLFGIKNTNNELTKRVESLVEKVIYNLIKVDKEHWLHNYIETASIGVLYLTEAEGKLDLAFELLNILIDSSHFSQTIKLFDKIEEIIIKKPESVNEDLIKQLIRLILIVSTNLYISQQMKPADKLYGKLFNLIDNVLKYKDLAVITLLKDAWSIESFIGYSHPENFWANLLYNAIKDGDASFSEMLYDIFMRITNNQYNIQKTIIVGLKASHPEEAIEAQRIELTLNKLKNQYKISLRLSQKSKIQTPVRVLDNFYIDQNARNMLLHIFEVVHYFPFSGRDKQSCELLIQDVDFLGWKVEVFGPPPDVDTIMGCKAEDLGCDLLYFLGRILFLSLPACIRDVFLHLKTDPDTPTFLQLQIDDIEIPWDFLHNGKSFLINELATGNIIMEPTEYKLIKPIEFGKDKINVLIIGNPLGDLQYTNEEAEFIRSALKEILIVDDVKILLGNEASRENVIDYFKSGKYQLIHYAGHTVFNDATPSKSGLVLKGEQILTCGELERILESVNEKKSYHPIVYLNSCDASKIKSVETKDGAIKFDGISISLIRGGALGCVGNYWGVEDEAIKEFSINFYKLLLAGIPVGEAMRQSRNLIYTKRLNSYEYEENGKKIRYENRSWGSPKLFGEVQIALVEKTD
ncbi:MAG TPA: CHAT domain-containing protein [Candidatus Deferrimicrobium sp.]|nr:CHAT domain-containing protein [Candidatus Deferrimicrobium sp.]